MPANALDKELIAVDDARVSRRAALRFAAGAAVLGLAASAAEASQPNEHQGSHDGHGAAAMRPKYQALIDAAQVCMGKGEVCMAHCIDMMKAGDTSMADCMQSVQAMLPMCATLARLSALEAKRLKAFVAVCRDVCLDCAAECKPHAKEHAVCKACMESCEACATECKIILDA